MGTSLFPHLLTANVSSLVCAGKSTRRVPVLSARVPCLVPLPQAEQAKETAADIAHRAGEQARGRPSPVCFYFAGNSNPKSSYGTHVLILIPLPFLPPPPLQAVHTKDVAVEKVVGTKDYVAQKARQIPPPHSPTAAARRRRLPPLPVDPSASVLPAAAVGR